MQDLHDGHCKTLYSAKHKNGAKKIEKPLHANTTCAAALRSAAHQMTGLGQSLRDPHSFLGQITEVCGREVLRCHQLDGGILGLT